MLYSVYNKISLLVIAIIITFAGGVSITQASVSGTNAKDVIVTIQTKQGGAWFDARTIHTNGSGTLKVEDALPGKYKFLIDDDDQVAGQSLGAEIRLLDAKGREIDKHIDVDVSVYIGSTKIPIATYRTDSNGWLDLAGITH